MRDPRPFDIPFHLRHALTSEQLADHDLAEYAHRAVRVYAEEKESSPDDWTPEQTELYGAGDWESFSRSRGYSDAEIDNFRRYMELALLLQARYDDVFPMSISYALSYAESSPADSRVD